jgi:hypothetical protein
VVDANLGMVPTRTLISLICLTADLAVVVGVSPVVAVLILLSDAIGGVLQTLNLMKLRCENAGLWKLDE